MTLHDWGNVFSGATIGGGFLIFIQQNATAISIMTMVFTAIVSFIFQILNYRVNNRHKEIDRRIMKEEIMKELRMK